MDNSSPPDLTLFLDILFKLEELDIPYVIIGGFAATMYGITRATYDIDVVANMAEEQCDLLANAYPLPRYYADPYQMKNAIKTGSSFNIIDTERGEKADIFPLMIDGRYQLAFENRVRQEVDIIGRPSFSVWAATPEDVIVGKLMAWEEGRSRRHSSDIYEMLLFYYLGGLGDSVVFDESYVATRAQNIGEDALGLWELLRNSAKEEADKN